MELGTDTIEPRTAPPAASPWHTTPAEFDKTAVFADPVTYLRDLGLETELVNKPDRLDRAA